jgi:hypothetical protein
LRASDPSIAIVDEHPNVVIPFVLYATDELVVWLLGLELVVRDDELLLMSSRTGAEVHFLQTTPAGQIGYVELRTSVALEEEEVESGGREGRKDEQYW